MLLAARLKTALFVAALLLPSGCVETVEKKRPRKGPVPEVGYIETGGGEVRFSAEGWGIVVGLRRRAALRRMRRVCKSKDLTPKIVDEWTHEDADAVYSDSGDEMEDVVKRGSEHYRVAPYHHLQFECHAAEKPAVKEPAK
jgi:hypothetical protein